MAISTTDMLRYDNHKKSTGVAYVLLIFLGWFGIQNFYIKRNLIAVIQVSTAILGLIFFLSGGFTDKDTAGTIGGILWTVNWILWTIDLFSIWHFVKKFNSNLLASLNDGTVLS